MRTAYSIFPVGPDKAPLVLGWQSKATRDPRIISQWAAHGARAWGIPTGANNGLFVIDLDVCKATGEPIGRDALLAMPRYAGLYQHRCVATPSGGRHVYLQHFEGARNTTSKIGAKIDTRGEGGYVIAPGSEVAGGFYVGRVPEILPVVPLGLRAMLTPQPRPTREITRISPDDEVQELLSYIPADLAYSDWVAVLMALHDRFGGSEEGLALADRWSATGAKYKPGEVATKWVGFKRGGVSWATIPAMARRHGANLSQIARRYAA